MRNKLPTLDDREPPNLRHPNCSWTKRRFTTWDRHGGRNPFPVQQRIHGNTGSFENWDPYKLMVYETIPTKLGRKKIPNYFPLNNKTGPVLFNCSGQLEGKNIKSNINTAPQTSHIFQGLKEPPTLPLAPEPIGTKISQQRGNKEWPS